MPLTHICDFICPKCPRWILGAAVQEGVDQDLVSYCDDCEIQVTWRHNGLECVETIIRTYAQIGRTKPDPFPFFIPVPKIPDIPELSLSDIKIPESSVNLPPLLISSPIIL